AIRPKINQQLHSLRLPDHHAAIRSQASGFTPLQGTRPDYRDLLGKHGIASSMSAKGCCWDNGVVESFFSTLKLVTWPPETGPG
ncbi:hypothetical protein ACLD7X_014290, partial [Aphanothece microscopica RSMan92]